MTRTEAKQRGLKYYETGRPCKHGHQSKRLTTNGSCVECQLQRSKQWKREHPESLDYSAVRRWHVDNSERVAAIKRRSYERNRERHLGRAAEWRRANSERMREYKRTYRQRHPERLKAQRAARNRTGRIELSPSDRLWLNFIYETCPDGWHVDHVIPLQGDNVCGLHVPWNLQHLPPDLNRVKSNQVIQL